MDPNIRIVLSIDGTAYGAQFHHPPPMDVDDIYPVLNRIESTIENTLKMHYGFTMKPLTEGSE